MDDFTSTPTRKRPRRTLIWGLFGLTGVLMGTAWATGFATSNNATDGSNVRATEVFGQSAAVPQTASPYQAFVSAPENLAVSFDGLWGSIDADAVVFRASLTAAPAGTYYTDIYLRNAPDDWSSAQIKFVQLDCAAVAAGDFDTAELVAASDAVGTPKVMNITSADAHVSFHGLASGDDYCFGVRHSDTDAGEVGDHADDIDGTFLTRPATGVAPLAPQFTAVLNRSA